MSIRAVVVVDTPNGAKGEMGLLWRKRSLLLKLVVIVSTAWFTIAFLLYTDDGTSANRIAVPADEVKEQAGNDVGMGNAPPRVLPFKQEPPPQAQRKEEFGGVLVPPQDMAGEMGKPVVLATNLSGRKFLSNFYIKFSFTISLFLLFLNCFFFIFHLVEKI